MISRDTSLTQATIDACNGYDVLIHEVQTLGWLAKQPDLQPYPMKYHTKTKQLAEPASKAKPHSWLSTMPRFVLRPDRPQASSPEELLKGVLTGYVGQVVVGRDLDV